MTNFQLGDDGELLPEAAAQMRVGKGKPKRKRGEARRFSRLWLLPLTLLALGLIAVLWLNLNFGSNPPIDYPTSVPPIIITTTPGGYFDRLAPCEPLAADSKGFLLMTVEQKNVFPQLMRYDFDRQQPCLLSDPRDPVHYKAIAIAPDGRSYAAIQYHQPYFNYSVSHRGQTVDYAIAYYGADTTLTNPTQFENHVVIQDWAGNAQTLSIPSTRLINRPRWSADGQSLFYNGESTTTGLTDIYRLELASGTITPLTDNPRVDSVTDISPTDNRVVFLSDRTYVQGGTVSQPDSYELYVMNADGSNVERLTDNSIMDYAAVWSPDGTRLATLIESRSTGQPEQIIIIDLATGTRKPLQHLPDEAIQLAWANDGWIYFTTSIPAANESGNTDQNIVCRIHPDGGQPELLFTLPEGAIEYFDIWTPPSNETTP